jgi:hypothetical protein
MGETSVFHAGGMTANSRGLSVAIPPENAPTADRTPAGCQQALISPEIL